MNSEEFVRHIFIIGSKSIGQYGGFETFVDHLLEGMEHYSKIMFHVACKANGPGAMDESSLNTVQITKLNTKLGVTEFYYKGARVYKIQCPNMGPAVAIYYDIKAVNEAIKYCKENEIVHPIFYILACRIGIKITSIKKQIGQIGGSLYLNPDGHEWKRAKWSLPVKCYWKWSEKKMISLADLVVCDSVSIEKYVRSEYGVKKTCYISYGAEVKPSVMSDHDSKFLDWLNDKKLRINEYYLIVGRFVPENNYEIMIREYMQCKSHRSLVIICNENDKLKKSLDRKLHYGQDPRIKFVGTVYDRELLKKIRENAYGYLHGHEVGGTNPSLLEALGSTKINLLLDVGFNREVGLDAAFYWGKAEGELSALLEDTDGMSLDEIKTMGAKAQKRVTENYSWEKICHEYKKIFTWKNEL
ncbi:MAG: DUF1972 domain-containing protein [Lachnospiraceae bacterium]|nr:DUF1972 domain-containing protein [Lachnospiraceae bacterium]